ncbi:hypothetical protein [Streptomyces phaeochromogenes]|uniref:hypothetical protein n=1 Tax=Streptomyces phaeochromogenes TaxID=1923 RepID=UPI002DD9A1B8|nr:hypothetical protein [Streptomyces phaeochromogenes]WRZ28839.1 hypothetical protein OG931_14280 [Streptomyces phaeochromogenes]
MGEFTDAVEQVRGVWDGLEVAHLARDAFSVVVAAGELDDALRLAREHDIAPGAGSGGVMG